MDPTDSRAELIANTAGVTTGLGVLTFALFPLAIPILALTLVALLPLALPLVVLAPIAAILVLAWLGIRAAGRGIRRLGGARPRPDDAPAKGGLAGERPTAPWPLAGRPDHGRR